MKRRKVLAVGVFGLASAAVPAFAKQPVKLIYVGGWDCGPCITWKNTKKAVFIASKERMRVDYVEIESPKLKEAYEDRYWPQELRPIREQLPRKGGTPRFIIVKGSIVVSNQWGTDGWRRTWQKLQEILA
jgi:hypothetical protein